MSVACVDTSALVAVLFDEPEAEGLGTRPDTFSDVVSSNLLEAEIRSVMHREGHQPCAGRPPVLDLRSVPCPS